MRKAFGRRVVVTGIGLVTPLGCTTSKTWAALLNPDSTSAAKLFPLENGDKSTQPIVAMPISRHLLPPAPTQLLGRDTPLYVQYALLSAAQALSDAGLALRLDDKSAVAAGCSIGVGMGSIPDLVIAAELIKAGKLRRVSPFTVPRMLVNSPAGVVAQVHNLQGPNTAPSTACAAGAHAVIEGLHAIQRGEADVMVVGGSEGAIEEVGVAGFARARALSTKYATAPSRASRPFDVGRDGFVMGEGSGMLVLESESFARARGVECVYAEVAGSGRSGDAWHVTSAAPDGRGARLAMRAALAAAALDASQVGYVNAHATGTRTGDLAERRAIAAVFGGAACAQVVASSTKGATGHLLGAAGAVEAAFAALAVCTGRVPPTLNLEEVDADDDCILHGWGDVRRYLPGAAVTRALDVALSNSFGFGGTNASIVFTAPPPGFRRRQMDGASTRCDRP
jgi:3-oxoacyl-[acyl-carrier-protein] synthase II